MSTPDVPRPAAEHAAAQNTPQTTTGTPVGDTDERTTEGRPAVNRGPRPAMGITEFRAVAEQIASALGDGWTAVCEEPASPWLTRVARLHGPDRIVVRAQLPPGWGATAPRWHVDGERAPGELGFHVRASAPRPREITMAAGKSAAQLAADIRHRYLGAWTAHVTAIRALLEGGDRGRARVIRTGDALIDALDGRATWQNPNPSTAGPGDLDPARQQVTFSLDDGSVTGSVTIHRADPPGGETATIELHGPAALAIALADDLATRYPQRPST